MLSKGDQTKDQIIQKSILLFSKHGYENTSFQMIADLCHVGKATPSYHFKNKFGLFEEVVKYIQEKRRAYVLQSQSIKDNAHQKLSKYFHTILTWALMTVSEAEVLLLMDYFSAIDNKFAELAKDILLEEQHQLEDYLLSGKREGIFHFTEDASQLAKTLQDALKGLFTNVLAGRKLVATPRELEKRAQILIDKLTNYKGQQGDL